MCDYLAGISYSFASEDEMKPIFCSDIGQWLRKEEKDSAFSGLM